MSKEYENIENFLNDNFPSLVVEKKDKEKTSLQDYIDMVSSQFNEQIEKIIAR